jgi:hypothetical protein
MILRLTHLWRWHTAVNHWLTQPWLIWATLLLVAVALLIPYTFSFSIEKSVRITGLVFQVLGLLTVADGLRKTRKLFNRPGLTTLAAKWFGQFPSFARKPYLLNVSENARVSDNVDAVLIRNSAQALSIEQRLALIEDRLAGHDDLIRKMETNIAGESHLQREALQSESRSRESADKTLQRQLEEFAAGGLHLEAIGLFWILLGVSLATASVEITWIIDKLTS